MARVLADDMDHTVSSPDKEVLTWHFAFGPENAVKTYSIDLLPKNFEKLEKALQPFVDVASEVRRAPVAPRRTAAAKQQPSKKVTKSGKTMQEVREWLRAEGYEVNDRGALSKENKERWNYGNPEDPLN